MRVSPLPGSSDLSHAHAGVADAEPGRSATLSTRRRAASLTVLLAALTLAACASAPSPAPAIAAGTSSVDAARSSGADELSAVEINEARRELERARALAQAGDERGAIRMAERADVDAQLARAKAGSERAKRAVAEVEAGLRTLRDELNRGATTQPIRP